MRTSWAAVAVLAAFFLVCVRHAWRVAPGEAPDEPAHTEYAAHLAQRGTLPVFNWPENPYGNQMIQPPAYYWAGGMILKAAKGLSLLSRLRLLRLLSAVLQTGALFFIWLIGRRLFQGNESLAPLLLAASLPMASFIGGSVTNDAAVNLAGAAMLWAVLARRPEGWSWDVGLGVLFGAALLCKATALPVIGACSLYLLWPDPACPRRGWRRLAAIAATALAVAGWFYARNYRLYGDPWGYSRIQLYDTARFGWSELPTWLSLYFQSFWGRFGWMTRPMPLWTYALLGLFTAAVAVGWLRDGRALASRPGRRLLLLAMGLTLLQNFMYGFLMTHQPQGRHSFVALGAWAVLFYDGLSSWCGAWSPQRTAAARWAAAAVVVAVQAAAWSRM